MFQYTPEISKEIQTRIRVLVAAFAYEVINDPVISDAEFDKLASDIDLSITTNRPDLDKWFLDNFDKFTGSWVWSFPELAGIESIYWRVHKKVISHDDVKKNNLMYHHKDCLYRAKGKCTSKCSELNKKNDR